MGSNGVVHYDIPAGLWPGLGWAVLSGGQRSFLADARRMMANLKPPMRVLGAEFLPQGGPALVTMNHYMARGFWAPWMAAAITSTVEMEIYWTMAGALTFPGRPMRGLLRRISAWLLQRVAQVYGFNTMPPMPPDPREVAERAAGVRRIVSYLREHPRGLIALAPEGGDQQGGRLSLGPEGAGRLALALTGKGMPVYPVGVYEEQGRFTIHFGRPYTLTVDTRRTKVEQDLEARREMMRAIAALLPEDLRGELGESGGW